jgi:hypothetical protein
VLSKPGLKTGAHFSLYWVSKPFIEANMKVALTGLALKQCYITTNSPPMKCMRDFFCHGNINRFGSDHLLKLVFRVMMATSK